MMSPEDELCLLLARGQLSPTVQERAVGLLATSLHWEQLLQRAQYEHSAFLACHVVDILVPPGEVVSAGRAWLR